MHNGEHVTTKHGKATHIYFQSNFARQLQIFSRRQMHKFDNAKEEAYELQIAELRKSVELYEKITRHLIVVCI